MPFYGPAIAVAIILALMGIAAKIFPSEQRNKGGNVYEKHKHCCEHEPLEVIVKFEEPLEVNISVTLIEPEPEIKGELTLGPVSEKKDKI